MREEALPELPNLKLSERSGSSSIRSLPPIVPAGASQTRKQGLQEDITVPVFNWQREEVGQYTLQGDVFDRLLQREVIHTVVKWQRARRRQGTAKGKTRSEVSGGGRKPWAQKGSGRARTSSIRGPQRVGGGKAFPPQLRDYDYPLPKKVRRLGLKCALSAKAWESRLVLVDSAAQAAAKTRELTAHLQAVAAAGPTARVSALVVDSGTQAADGGTALRLAARNIPMVDAIPAVGLNVHSIVERDYLVMTTAAVEAVVARLRTPIRR